MSDPNIHLESALCPRSVNAIAEARHWGVPRTFRNWVRFGIAPQPRNIPQSNRDVFDRHAIDSAMTARAVRHGVA